MTGNTSSEPQTLFRDCGRAAFLITTGQLVLALVAPLVSFRVFLAASTLIIAAATLSAAVFISRRSSRSITGVCSLCRCSGVWIAAGAVLGCMFPFVSALISAAWCALLESAGIASGEGTTSVLLESAGIEYIVIVTAAVAFAPWQEEIIWRGWVADYMANGFEGRGIGCKLTVVCTVAFCFALLHFSLTDFPALLIMGILLGVLRCKSHSILPCILMHLANNITVIILA